MQKNTGHNLIKSLLPKIPDSSGVYKMLNHKNMVLYVGKAKDLQKRITSYSKDKNHGSRIEHMLAQVTALDFVVTKTEVEALLLEADLIKNLKPKYNILLRDDKSYPYIHLDTSHSYPRITKIRVKYKKNLDLKNLFGPFASTLAVNEAVDLIQKIFLLRSCSDYTFNTRKKPCILYQLKRCSAPCVDKISYDNYKDAIKQTITFLHGKNLSLKESLIKDMTQASNDRNFEKALIYRDRIQKINQIQTKQNIILNHNINADFIAIATNQFISSIQVFIFREGHSKGTLVFYPKHLPEDSMEEILSAFIPQFYTTHEVPEHIFLNMLLREINLLQEALSFQKQQKVVIKVPKSGTLKEVMDTTSFNAQVALEQQIATSEKWYGKFQELAKLFNIISGISKIEIYDNSHLYGTHALGVMVCAEYSGFNKKNYRIFKLKDVTIKGNDDFGILREVIRRRFLRALKNNEILPELILIDGGLGQLNIAKEVLVSLGLNTKITAIGIAKGKNRHIGEEKLILDSKQILTLNEDSASLHFIQHLRNEAHRFAIKNQRKSKLKEITKSELDAIPSIGIKRKRDLLNNFGSAKKISEASINELLKVPNINLTTATLIYNWFHN